MNETKTDNSGQPAPRTDATVRQALNLAIERKCLTPELAEEIFWLHGYGLAHHLGNTELVDLMGKYDKSTLGLVFSGKYDAKDWSPFARCIQQLHRRVTNDILRVDVGFIETDTAKTIWKICDNALYDHMPAFVDGASQIGKTRSLEEYVRRANNPAIKYMYCPPGMTPHGFARKLAKTCNCRNLKSKTAAELVDEIANSFNTNSLLILDEFAHLTDTVSDRTSKILVDFVRMIYDVSHCGLVVSYTQQGREDIETGKNHKFFEQFFRRGVLHVSLPEVPSIKDINAFSKAFGLEPPHGEALSLVKEINLYNGLSTFIAYLQKASGLTKLKNEKAAKDAAAKGIAATAQPLTWDFFLATARGFRDLRNIKSDYEKSDL